MVTPGSGTIVTVEVNSKRLRSDPHGFARLARLHHEISPFSNATIHIDMSKLIWLDGHLSSALLIVIRRSQLKGNTLQFANTNPTVKSVLRRNGLFRNRMEDRARTTMPIREFGLEEAVEFSRYARQHFSRREMPKMSAALENKFYEGVDELFANSALHSNASIKLVVCGQFYPRTRVLDFSMVDGGRSIPGSLRESGIVQQSDGDAIDWAMAPGNTTRQGDIPGGLGLKVLREFIQLNGGKLTMVSGAGFWTQNTQGVSKEMLSHPYPGTIAVLEINTSDKNLYDLVGGPSAKDIW